MWRCPNSSSRKASSICWGIKAKEFCVILPSGIDRDWDTCMGDSPSHHRLKKNGNPPTSFSEVNVDGS